MAISVQNNDSARLALQGLNRTTDALRQAQTQAQGQAPAGSRIAGARDAASTSTIGQGPLADISALRAVTDSLNRATSIADVANTAGQTISDLLHQLKQKVVAATDPSLSTDSRSALDDDYTSLLGQIRQTYENASFDGANLLDGSMTSGLRLTAGAGASITLSPHDLSLGGSIISLPPTSTIATSNAAARLSTVVEASIGAVNGVLASLGAQASQIQAHNTFVSKLSDALVVGATSDMGAESARLQALQVQQQLGAQALSVANQAPQIILSLFK